MSNPGTCLQPLHLYYYYNVYETFCKDKMFHLQLFLETKKPTAKTLASILFRHDVISVAGVSCSRKTSAKNCRKVARSFAVRC